VPRSDLPLAELRTYRIGTPEPADLDSFWARGLADARARATEPRFEPYRSDLYGPLAVDDVTFSGAGGDPIRAWLIRPRAAPAPLPCLVQFIGYGGGRGLPADHALYPAAGFATFVMDTRGQGGWWTVGHTGDPGAAVGGPEHPGVMTRGLGDPETYYYRRLFVDAVRAVETAAGHPAVDPGRIGVGGKSQGGALSLVAAALTPELVRLCHADVPFLCDFERSMELADEPPFTELVSYLAHHRGLVDAARRTLAYHDVAHLAGRVRARTLVSVGLMDSVCPPSGVFAAYNAIPGPKEIVVNEWIGHEMPSEHAERRLEDFSRELR
jgi:cephalosporin-C deacetylase